MKKIILLFLIPFFSLCLVSFKFASFNNGTINDETTVEEDLVNLQLSVNDYVDVNSKINKEDISNYDKDYVIAVAENRITNDTINLYIYVYNPIYKNSNSAFKINLKVNEKTYEITLSDNNNLKESVRCFNVLKYKVEINNPNLVTNYQVNEVENVIRNKISNEPFSATFKTNEKNIIETTFEYNSYLYITDDILQPVIVSEKTGFSNNFMNLINSLFGNSPWDQSTMFFYNFNSSRVIDEIIDCDVSFTSENKLTQFYRPYPFGPIKEHTSSISKNKKYLISSTNDSRIEILGEYRHFKAFKSSKDRINEFGTNVSFTNEMKEKFNNFTYSILIGIENYRDTRDKLGEGFKNETIIKDFKLTRMKFKTNGVLYNSFVGDQPNDQSNPITPQESKSWWDIFLDGLIDYVSKNPLKSLAIFALIIVLFPVVIQLFPLLIKGVSTVIIGVIKLAIFIILLPFKLIIKPFKGKK